MNRNSQREQAEGSALWDWESFPKCLRSYSDLGWSCCCFTVFPGVGWFERPCVCHRGEGKALLWVSPLSHPLTP